MKFCSKMGRRAAEFMFGAAVMCFGMSVFGMQENGNNTGNRCVSTNEFGEPVSSERLTQKYFKVDVDVGYAAWEKDLFTFASREFKNKLDSLDVTERTQAMDEMDGWSYVTALSLVYEICWWKDVESTRRAQATLTEAKRLAEQNNNDKLVRSIERIIQRLPL